MNELPADGPRPRVGPGRRIDDRHACAAYAHTPSADVRLLVRPEDLRLVEADAGLPGTVASTTFQGASTVVGVRLDVLDSLVSVHLPGTSAVGLAPGERVNVGIDGTRAVCETVAV